MKKTVPSTLSADGVMHLTCPKSWAELTQEQLRYVMHLIGCGLYTSVEVRTLMLLRFCGISVQTKIMGGWYCSIITMVEGEKKPRKHFFFLNSWQVQSMIQQLKYVDSYETMNVRLESIQGFKAVDNLLHGVRFYDYLNMEKYYQGWLATREKRYALGLAQYLYPGGVTDIDEAELTNCQMWFSYVKKQFSRFFPHFFKPSPLVKGKVVNWLEQMNAQIRALTDGDITKEQAVYDKDCWRALTELDAKAHEAEEFRKKYPNT